MCIVRARQRPRFGCGKDGVSCWIYNMMDAACLLLFILILITIVSNFCFSLANGISGFMIC
jgi:hypothetical protein